MRYKTGNKVLLQCVVDGYWKDDEEYMLSTLNDTRICVSEEEISTLAELNAELIQKIKERIEALEKKSTKTSTMNDLEYGEYRALEWVLLGFDLF